MFGFIGPNGAGKSTTIRFLATLLKATRGEGIVNGHSVNDDPMAVRQSVGYMPDNFGVYDGMKVWEFLDFFAVRLSDRARPSQEGHIRCAGTAGPGPQTRRFRQRSVARHEAAAVSGQDAGARSARADPGRAGQRAGSARTRGGQGAAERTAADGQDDSHLQPHPDRAGRLLHVRSASSNGASC